MRWKEWAYPSLKFMKFDKKETIEENIERLGGWKEKGLRSKFDTAMLNKDYRSVRELSPRVPKYYRDKFKSDIREAKMAEKRYLKEERKEAKLYDKEKF